MNHTRENGTLHEGDMSAPVEGLAQAESRAGAYRRVLANKSFRRLWESQFVSAVGDWLVIGILMPAVTKLSGGSSFAVAGIMIAKIIPSLFLGSLIGVFVDRFDRRRVMMTADAMRALLVLLLIFTPRLWAIYLVVLLMECASLFFVPAKNALIPALVDEQDVATANGLSYTTQQASMLVGLTASGAILAVFERAVRFVFAANLPFTAQLEGLLSPHLLGSSAGYIVDSLTFVFSALAILSIPGLVRRRRREGRLDLHLVGKDVVESFRFLAAHSELRGLLVTVGLAILGGGAIIPVGQVYVGTLTGGVPLLQHIKGLEALNSSPQTFILVFLALGMAVGALVVPRLVRRFRIQTLFLVGIAGFGISMLGFAVAKRYGVASLFAVAAGAFLADVTVSGNTYVVQTVADEIRGRVFTALESVIRVSLLVSMIVTAPLGDLASVLIKRFAAARDVPLPAVLPTGPRLTLIIASAIVLGASVFAYRVLEGPSQKEVRA